MEIKTILPLVAAALAGILLGVFYFGGLWLTIRRLTQASRPTLLLLVSYILRIVITLIGFYFVANGHLERLFACLALFFLTRFLFVKHIQLAPERSIKTHGN